MVRRRHVRKVACNSLDRVRASARMLQASAIGASHNSAVYALTHMYARIRRTALSSCCTCLVDPRSTTHRTPHRCLSVYACSARVCACWRLPLHYPTVRTWHWCTPAEQWIPRHLRRTQGGLAKRSTDTICYTDPVSTQTRRLIELANRTFDEAASVFLGMDCMQTVLARLSSDNITVNSNNITSATAAR